MDVVLPLGKLQHAPDYFENFFIIPKTPGKYIDHVQSRLSLFRDVNVTLKLTKCVVVAGPRRSELASQKSDAIRDLKPHTTVMVPKSFLVLYSVF